MERRFREATSEVVSLDQLDQFSAEFDGGDGSPVSSQYTSCGESEFDRYCSANSEINTPSIYSCSFRTVNEFMDSEFGSAISFGIGDDSCLENFSLGESYRREFQSRKLSSLSNSDCLEGKVADALRTRTGFDLFGPEEGSLSGEVRESAESVPLKSAIREGSLLLLHEEEPHGLLGNAENVCNQETLNTEAGHRKLLNRSQSLNLGSDLQFGERKQGNSSMYEHSEGYTNYRPGNSVLSFSQLERRERVDASENPLRSEVQGAKDSIHHAQTCSLVPSGFMGLGRATEQEEDMRDKSLASNMVEGAIRFSRCQSASLDSSTIAKEYGLETQKAGLRIRLNVMDGGLPAEPVEGEAGSISSNQQDMGEQKEHKKVRPAIDEDIKEKHQSTLTKNELGLNENQASESQRLEMPKIPPDPLSDMMTSQFCSTSSEAPTNQKENSTEDCRNYFFPFENNTRKIPRELSISSDLFENHPAPTKPAYLDLIESYDDVVHEMEEILLQSGESPGARLNEGSSSILASQLSLLPRDCGSTASTSCTGDAFLLNEHSISIDDIELVGATQKKGDVSLGERLVGVKEFTVYRMKVWSGGDDWEVEFRYREFFSLYKKLREFYAGHGWVLPSPWSAVDRESRKMFVSASPDVVADRSILIQECLRSVLHSQVSSSLPSALIWFLSPQGTASRSLASTSRVPADTQLGKTVSLKVDIGPCKTLEQLLEAQHYTCAGCHRLFDDGSTFLLSIAQTFGWGKFRFCEYTGQLFCSSCHTNETAVLPARVLHHWDFSQYPVSQLAKSYLDSIHDKPMLCVGAVNPFLFTKVPALLHVMNVRKKIGYMLPYVRCPYRRSINKGLGSRRYLLGSNDFFALRDLIDLSKGAFAALPVMLETVSRKILEHITELCLICYDQGVPCGARQACRDPASLIFPFQDGEIQKCRTCQTVFHERCFRNLRDCPCGTFLCVDGSTEPTKMLAQSFSGEEDGAMGLMRRRNSSHLPSGFFSGLFSTARQEKKESDRDGETVMLMGSLPDCSL